MRNHPTQVCNSVYDLARVIDLTESMHARYFAYAAGLAKTIFGNSLNTELSRHIS